MDMEKCGQKADGSQNALAKQYEELICKLPGVLNSSVVFTEQGLSEIHILADSNRAPKRITRDVQSALTARFGAAVDYRLISIAQIPVQGPSNMRVRLIFDEISLIKSKEHATATVSLTDGEQTYTGTASALSERTEVNKMVCQATLEAVEDYIDGKVELTAADVKEFDLDGEKAVAICAIAKKDDHVKRYIGSTFLGEDKGMAIVKATLDALNRKITVI